MTLAKNQDKTGFEREDSPNDTKRTGRSDGTVEEMLTKTGPRFGESTPEGGKAGRGGGFGQTNRAVLGEEDDSDVETLAIGAQPLGEVDE